MLHGSVGFLVEEIDLKAMPLFPSPLKQASDAIDALIVSVAKRSDEEFERELENLHPRVFRSVERLIRNLHQATVRVVDEVRDEVLTTQDVDQAYVRLEAASVEEEQFTEDGLLIGLLPYGERFEFRRSGGQLITGKVSHSISEMYLKRLLEEQAVNRWWKATITRREIRRFGRSDERFLLLDLQEIEQPRPDETGSTPSG